VAWPDGDVEPLLGSLANERRAKEQAEAGSAYPDGEQALRAARADWPDAAVLDVVLPGLPALRVYRALRAERTAPHRAATDRPARPGGAGCRRRRRPGLPVQPPAAGAPAA
jgi:DNA-binding response OmpR family regulator